MEPRDKRSERHAPATYVLLEQPRPGNRETRMREIGGLWLQRNQRKGRMS